MNLIALGRTAIGVARGFANYPQYDIYTISTTEEVPIDLASHYRLASHDSPEKYEQEYPTHELEEFLAPVRGETIFIVSGFDLESAASLRLLQFLTSRSQVRVIYVQPDMSAAAQVCKLMDNTVRGVLQQYARSGAFKGLVMISIPTARAMLGDVPIMQYETKAAELIASTVHMINVFDRTVPIYSDNFKLCDAVRIFTIGISNLETDEEKLFFPLDNIREKVYYYSIKKESIENDGTLMNKIINKTHAKVSSEEENNNRAGFSVYASEYDEDYVYLIAGTSAAQQ